MKVREPVYKKEVLQEVESVKDRTFPRSYYCNTLYKVNERKYLYENSQGYLHIVQIKKQNLIDNKTEERHFCGWIVQDQYIGKNGEIKESGSHYRTHETEEQARNAMLECWQIGNTCEKCACFSSDSSVGQTECNCLCITPKQTQKHYTDNAPGCPCFI